jgi:hypothetical protein
MGLLIPAVNAARETARRSQCGTQMRNLALAAIQHEETKGALPGYMEKFGNFIGDGAGGPGDDPSEPGVQSIPAHAKVGTWAVALLPWLEAQPTYEHWTQDRYPLIDVTGGEYEPTSNSDFEGTGFHPLAAPNLAIFQCPSNPITDANFGRNSYIVNTGDAFFRTNAAVAGDTPTPPSPGCAGPAWGLPGSASDWVKSMNRSQGAFNNKYQGAFRNASFTGDAMRLTDFKDGQGYTVLFSENVQALPWHRAGFVNATDLTVGIDYSVTPPVTDVVFNPDLNSAPPNPLAAARYTTGMVWHYEDRDASNMPPHPVTGITCLPVYAKHRINGRGQAVGQDIFTLQMTFASANYIDLARPSSAHVTGVNIATADGGTRYLNESIDYRVWQALMTPRGKSSSVPFPEYVLSDDSL